MKNIITKEIEIKKIKHEKGISYSVLACNCACL